MEITDPRVGRKLQDVEVNGLSFNHYAKCRTYLTPGTEVQLQPQPDNLHDSNAVAVMFGGHQMGWIPRVVNFDIAERLCKGEQLYAFVTRKSLGALQIAVHLAAAEMTRASLASLPGAALQRCSQDTRAEAIQRIRDADPGRAFICETTSTRTSITVSDGISDLAWIRKSALDEHHVQLAIAKSLVAVKQEDGSFALFDHVPTGANRAVPPQKSTATETKKENTMTISNTISATINNNKTAAKAAGYLEAGRIANNKLSKVAGKALPMMARGYADTAVGRLVLANIAQMAAAQLRPNDPTLSKLTMAMTTAAYQEVIQNIDIEGMLDSLMDSPEIKRAVSKLGDDEDETDHLMKSKANADRLNESVAQVRAGKARSRKTEE